MAKGLKVTREDVAREAQVSVSVVSRVLNQSGYVEKGKRKRVLEAAQKMGYIPNAASVALKTQKTYQIVFFCNDLTGCYFNQMYHGISRAAIQRGYHLLLLQEYEFDIMRKVLCDGIIFPTENLAQEYSSRIGKYFYLPTVAISFQPGAVYEKPMPQIIIDNHKVINEIIDYLLKLGHKKIGMIVPFATGYAHDRYVAWAERMKTELEFQACSISPDEYVLSVDSDKLSSILIEKSNKYMEDVYFSVSEGFEYYDLFELGGKMVESYVKARHKASVYIAFNDDLAMGFIEGLKIHGIKVPDDVSVMGIDGIFKRRQFSPLLTTMSIYPEIQGAMGAEVLINMLEGKKFKYMNYAPNKILEGKTVANLRTDC